VSDELIQVVWVPCDPQRPAELKLVGQGKLADYQTLVGGPIELVPLSPTGECDPGEGPCQCIGALFNEEGLGALPANERVNRYMRSVGLTNAGLGYYGDAVFIGLPPGEEFGPATPDTIAYWLPGHASSPDGENGPGGDGTGQAGR
jgi:hypothetical protein